MDVAQVTTLGALISAYMAQAVAMMVALAPYILIVAAIGAVIAIIVLCIKHWDKILHFTSGLILGMLGYVVFLNLVPKEAREKMNAWCSVIFSFLFGSACAGIWEIYEFTVDHLLGLLCQNNSLVDTMSDIIAGTITALIIAIM